ncbi:hypothetical protein ACHAXA_007926 [Cyclostephanos tholiformis]|uniref:Uncharacterized protein n=1 Tax=Cyclostephanos tholiformis TaxID=382380 RepID=A0ABD3R610_9STRA
MSPQFSAIISVNTSFSSHNCGWSSNASSGTSSVADLAWVSSAEHSFHKIESESSSETPLNPSEPLHKRSSSCVSLSLKNQHFRSLYGSAFLSGIFAYIAQELGGEPVISQDVAAYPAAVGCDSVSEPFHKRARITPSSESQPKSSSAQSSPAEGSGSGVPSPTVVFPWISTSATQIDLFNDSVHELQDTTFPSLPQIPVDVSFFSSTQLVAAMDEAGDHEDGKEDGGPYYGWFVSTDDEEADVAFRAITAPTRANQDLKVQQALAEDTIDDVLRDLIGPHVGVRSGGQSSC